MQFEENAVERLILALDREGAFDAPSGELSIAFVSKDEISRLHQSFMDDPSPTDVITFEGDSEIDQAGEICVCPEVALDYSQREQVDFSEELTLYLVHGYLHLCGFDDIEDDDRHQMREAEQTAMDILRSRQLLPRFSLS